MSKFLLNLLGQISKALLYSKIKFLFEKEFSFTFGPIGPAAAHLFSNRPLPLSPLGLNLSVGPARCLGLVDRASVAPCRLPPPIRESVFLENRLPFTNAYSAENLPPPLGPAHLASQPLGTRVPLAYFAEDVFFFDSRLPFLVPSLSPR
jgi:hypothetical protein